MKAPSGPSGQVRFGGVPDGQVTLTADFVGIDPGATATYDWTLVSGVTSWTDNGDGTITLDHEPAHDEIRRPFIAVAQHVHFDVVREDADRRVIVERLLDERDEPVDEDGAHGGLVAAERRRFHDEVAEELTLGLAHRLEGRGLERRLARVHGVEAAVEERGLQVDVSVALVQTRLHHVQQ